MRPSRHRISFTVRNWLTSRRLRKNPNRRDSSPSYSGEKRRNSCTTFPTCSRPLSNVPPPHELPTIFTTESVYRWKKGSQPERVHVKLNVEWHLVEYTWKTGNFSRQERGRLFFSPLASLPLSMCRSPFTFLLTLFLLQLYHSVFPFSPEFSPLSLSLSRVYSKTFYLPTHERHGASDGW